MSQYLCEDCRFRKNKLHCACCIHAYEREEHEDFVFQAMIYPQRNLYEPKEAANEQIHRAN